MIHFQIPRNSSDLYMYMECFFTDGQNPTPVISNSLSQYLNDIKHRINNKRKRMGRSKKIY